MKTSFRILSILVLMAFPTALLFAGSGPHYLITNDDAGTNTATIYTIADDGTLALKKVISTGGGGLGGGAFAINRAAVLSNHSPLCLYASNAYSGTISAINLSTWKVTGQYKLQSTYFNWGVGLIAKGNYVFAGYGNSYPEYANYIDTFKVLTNCKLKYLGSVSAEGLINGVTDGMALRGNLLIDAYRDGSIESFNTSNGMPVSNGDREYSTGFPYGDFPAGVDITADGKFAIFGDTPTESTKKVVVEVADVSGGNLKENTKVYNVGKGFNSNTVLLSPDESFLYIANNQGGTVTAVPFNKTTGKFGKSCISKVLKGFNTSTFYLGQLASQTTTGMGGYLYVAEFGQPSAIGIVKITKTATGCTVTEVKSSPVVDKNSQGLLSITVYPPRPF